ncbi:MAG: hypothetical protein JW845_00555 [Dehalococcoidales bacterium]|nr:hypothetical protein [Dehalococcoidales bacterium]
MERKPKRRRGGQPGNQNARKHGLYSSRLSVDQLYELANILNRGGEAPALIALRIKLASALKSAPDSRRVLMEASKILSKWYLSNSSLSKKDHALFKSFIRAAFKKIQQNQSFFTERIVSGPSKTPENLTERIVAKNPEKTPSLALK